MNIDEVKMFAPSVQRMLDEYGRTYPIAHQCFAVSAELSRDVERLIHHRVPLSKSSSISLEIGNLIVDGNLLFPVDVAKSIAHNLPPRTASLGHSAAYHAWLAFDSAIIDLSAIYTVFSGEDVRGLEPGAIFISSDGTWLPQDYGFQYLSYRSWTLNELEAIV